MPEAFGAQRNRLMPLPKIKDAEYRSIEQFTEDEKLAFLRLLEKFSSVFSDELNK